MRCEEAPKLKLDDGATRIFLNTRGKHPELVSPELIELLKYMEHSTDEVSEVCKSERIQKMHRRICQIKASEKTGDSSIGDRALMNYSDLILADDPTGNLNFASSETVRYPEKQINRNISRIVQCF